MGKELKMPSCQFLYITKDNCRSATCKIKIYNCNNIISKKCKTKKMILKTNYMGTRLLLFIISKSLLNLIKRLKTNLSSFIAEKGKRYCTSVSTNIINSKF